MAEANRVLSPKAAFRLDAAADLLQAPVRGGGGWGLVIKVQAGETWHQAVLRTIKEMPQAAQAHLKGLVDWVEDYERGATAKPALRPPAPAAAPAPVRVETATVALPDDSYAEGDEDAVAMAMLSVEEFETDRPRP